ncbi:Nitrogen permease regulator 2-like protein [Armadillidium nasatum]|uniref:Nitrogen permease regulator 2-like protein n=1 Tax=Armadillidium nasatum TaxID=96803 RepID=A0A5N5STR3_9CRUS|nr:Nitrogen permease regulator 2-like protein [Armadillidium nasatum]
MKGQYFMSLEEPQIFFMEEEGIEGKIECIFLCKFHPDLGPIIVCQYPENYFSKEVFESIHNYLISKLQIKKKTITLSVFGNKVSGYPNEIKDFKYLRNALIYNLCFVCDSKSRSVQYEPVVKKISEYLENFELENGFLSSQESTEKLSGILKEIIEGLNNYGQCTVKISLQSQPLNERRVSFRSEKKPEIDYGKSLCGKTERRYSLYSDRKNSEIVSKKNSEIVSKINKKPSESKDKEKVECQSKEKEPYISVLNLKQVVRIRSDPIQVQDHHVPILMCSKNKILPYIDGLSHIAKIAAEADVHNNLVKACVQNLVYYRVVKLLPIFQYSNVYVTLPGLHALYTNKDIQDKCLRAVSKSSVQLPTLSNVFQMYSSMTYGVSVRDLSVRFRPQLLFIEEQKLIQFGVLHGFIRRIHHYPIILNPKISDEANSGPAISSYIKLCNGSHSIDEICCKYGLPFQEVYDKLERDSNVVIIMK